MMVVVVVVVVTLRQYQLILSMHNAMNNIFMRIHLLLRMESHHIRIFYDDPLVLVTVGTMFGRHAQG